MAAKLIFSTLAGDTIELLEEPTSVAEARQAVAESLKLRYESQVVFLLPDGCYLTDNDALPMDSIVQVQTLPPPEGTWLRIRWDAANFDEEVLHQALEEAFPPPLHEICFSADPPKGWHPMDYWSEDEKWARWTSLKMMQATERTLGEWANYWRVGEMADSYGYWMVEAPYRSKTKTIGMTIGHVKHWKSLLDDLHATFVSVQKRTNGMGIADTWEIAAAEFLKYSPQFTGKTSFKYGFEMWYRPFQQVLEWYGDFAALEGCGKVDGIISGVFSSYSVRPDGAMQFAKKMANFYGVDFQSFDATAQWLENRPFMKAIHAKTYERTKDVIGDAHFHYISTIDFSRSPERAERMKEALRMVRHDAATHDNLTLGLVSRWQAIVLGAAEMTIRRTDAYAKEGRERYPHSEDLHNKFETALKDATGTTAPEIRAARAYLDVCFYHPFDDGNARLARLVLDFVLTRAGLCLEDIGGLFALPRRADDQAGAKSFVEVLQEYLAPLGPRRDDDLEEWFLNSRETSLLQIPSRRRYDGTDYEWFDCLAQDALLDRE